MVSPEGVLVSWGPGQVYAPTFVFVGRWHCLWQPANDLQAAVLCAAPACVLPPPSVPRQRYLLGQAWLDGQCQPRPGEVVCIGQLSVLCVFLFCNGGVDGLLGWISRSRIHFGLSGVLLFTEFPSLFSNPSFSCTSVLFFLSLGRPSSDSRSRRYIIDHAG